MLVILDFIIRMVPVNGRVLSRRIAIVCDLKKSWGCRMEVSQMPVREAVS